MNKYEDVANIIDHTLLKPEATIKDVRALIEEAEKLGTYSVCVSPSRLPLPCPTTVKVAAVVGFPSGAVKPEIKAAEAARCVADGADEIDMVIDLANAMAGDYEAVYNDILTVRNSVPKPVVLKVIIESAVLNDEQIVEVCKAAMKAEADFVKTSTGFHPAGGASEHAVKLMYDTVAPHLQVKASGGIRDTETALKMIKAGATRLGLSASATILEGLK